MRIIWSHISRPDRQTAVLLVCFVSLCVVAATPCLAIDYFSIDSDPDSSYLPYRLREVVRNEVSSAAVHIRRHLLVMTQADTLGRDGQLARANNPGSQLGGASYISIRSYPEGTVVGENPVSMSISDWSPMAVDSLDHQLIGGVGYRIDSVFAFVLDPVANYYRQIYLTDLRPKGNEHKIVAPHISLFECSDWDNDGRVEMIVMVNRPHQKRELFCLEADPLRIRWVINLASGMDRIGYNFPVNRSETGPNLILTTYNSKNGRVSDLFSDQYSYLTTIEPDGTVSARYIMAVQFGYMVQIRAGKASNRFYVTHAQDFVNPDSTIPDVSDVCYLSKVNGDGDRLKTITIDGTVWEVWMAPYGDKHEDAVFVNRRDDVIDIYDTSLALVAQVDSARMGRLLAVDRISGREEPVLVYPKGIYSLDYEPLMRFPGHYRWVDAMSRDASGAILDIVLDSDEYGIVGRIEKKPLVDLALVFYHRNQTLIMSLFSALAMMFILMTISRSRHKRAAVTIANQKAELEKTYKLLRDAQEKIIAAEKYKTVRDIAGGYAHEIRNALFPAVVALQKLVTRRCDEIKAGEAEESRMALQAVRRAVKTTEVISRYARMEESSDPKPVTLASVLRDIDLHYADSLRTAGIDLQVVVAHDIAISGDKEQFFLLFSNLMANAIDALADTPTPQIRIEATRERDQVCIQVRDNGCGLDRETLTRVLDPFYTTKPDTGRGLGLAIAHRVIQNAGGTISLYSTPGAGTTVAVCVPSVTF